MMLPKSFTLTFHTPQSLIQCVGYVNTVLNLQSRDENEWELRNNPKLYRKKTSPAIFLVNFIMNNIPSMFYLNKNKKYLNIDR